MIKCKTFSRNHNSPSGIYVEDDVNYFIEEESKKGKFELISQSHNFQHIPNSNSRGEDNSEDHFSVTIFYKTDEKI